jgi:hypothetical protein
MYKFQHEKQLILTSWYKEVNYKDPTPSTKFACINHIAYFFWSTNYESIKFQNIKTRSDGKSVMYTVSNVTMTWIDSAKVSNCNVTRKSLWVKLGRVMSLT